MALPNKRKICCVGFQKTGTSSLANALRRLGYRVGKAHSQINEVLDPNAADADAVVEAETLRCMDEHDALQDSPCSFMFEALDKAFPDSKFILTYRPVESWLGSYAKFFPDENNSLRKWMYGVPRFSGHEDTYKAIYESQNNQIRSYFHNRPESFLELNLAEGQGWHELVTFLGPDMLPPFPHKNAHNPDRVHH
ncbi:MAG: sulfotransferase family protein [Marinosulfonomonas sp.]